MSEDLWCKENNRKSKIGNYLMGKLIIGFSASLLSLIMNIHIEHQCRDAKDSSEWHRRSDENTSLGTLGGLSPELLESMLRNDGPLTESGIDVKFDVEEGTQHESNSMQVKPLD